MRSQKDKPNRRKVKKSKKNRKKDTKKNVKDHTSTAAHGCFSPKICKGKHIPMTQDKTLLENAEKLFKNQQIRVVNTVEECQEVVQELLSHCEEYSLLGFFCKYLSRRPGHPVAMLQLASHRGLCALIRLCEIKKIPNELQELLENQSILKVGIQPLKDEQYLIRDYGINCVASLLDLRRLAKDCGIRSCSLGRLTKEHLNVEFIKNPCVCAFGWDDKTLRKIRIENAAKDVHTLIELFKKFAEKLKPRPIDVDQQNYLQDFIKEYCAEYVIVEMIPSVEKAKPKPTSETKANIFRNQTIHVIKSVEGCQFVMQILKSHCDEYNVLGVKFLKADVGSNLRPAKSNLLQLATHRGLCATIFLNELEYIPKELEQLLQDSTILKVGVKLIHKKTNKEIRIAGTLELNYLLSIYNKKPLYLNLSRLCKWFLKTKIDDKTPKKLKDIEENYTKNEALLAIEVFKQFTERLEFERDNNDQKKNLDAFIKRYCLEYLDKKYNVADVHFCQKLWIFRLWPNK